MAQKREVELSFFVSYQFDAKIMIDIKKSDYLSAWYDCRRIVVRWFNSFRLQISVSIETEGDVKRIDWTDKSRKR